MIECHGIEIRKNGWDMWKGSAHASAVLKLLLQNQFGYGGRFVYYISGARDEDGPAACLEVMRFGDGGEVAGETFFTGFGEEASLLSAFARWFLNAPNGTHLRVAMMLSAGIVKDEDIRAGLRLRSLDALRAAIEAAKKHGFGLHFFVHIKDEKEAS